MSHPIPLTALDDRLGFVGTAGSGKTYNAGSGVERVLASGGRVVIPDPLGVWWGLGLCADGLKPAPWREKGKLVIFGGPHGDMPLTEHAGALIGETVAGMAESAILDLSDLGTKASEVRFMLAFLTALYRHASNEPLHLIFDEADMWAPQQERDKGESPKLLGMMETVVRRGRIKGFIPWLITQRPAVLNKNVLSQVDGLVAFKLTASQDRAALGAWIEGQADRVQGKEILDSLPTLQRGTGVVWIPTRGILTTAAFPEKITFDSSRTPARGERVERKELKPVDLDKLKGKLASLEEEQKANDPRALKNEVARLTRELAKAAKIKAAPPQVVHANADEIDEAREAGRQQGFQEGIDAAAQAVASIGGKPAQRAVRRVSVTAEPQLREAVAPTTIHGDLSGPQQRLLDALAWWRTLGFDTVSRTQMAFIAAYKPNTGTFNTYLGQLSTAGLIAYPRKGCVALTDAGIEKANEPDGGAPLHDRVKAILSGPQIRLLEPLLEKHPQSLSRTELANAAGYQPNTGTFNTYLGQLSTLNLIAYPERGFVRAEDWLFP